MSFKPTDKSPLVEELITTLFGIDRRAIIENSKCVFCDADVNEESFKDELSKKEYTISGMCQKCQDKVLNA